MPKNIDDKFDRTDDKPTVAIEDTGICVVSKKLGVSVRMPDHVFAEAVIEPKKQSEPDEKPIRLVSASRKAFKMHSVVKFLSHEAGQNPDEVEIKDVIPQGKRVFLVGPNIDMRVKAFRKQYLRAIKPLLEDDGAEAENEENIIKYDFTNQPDIEKVLQKQRIDIHPTCTLYAQSSEEILINEEELAGGDF